jgi:hypothetical protein
VLHFGRLLRKIFWSIWDRCYDFKNIFAKKFSKNFCVYCSNYYCFFAKIVIITLFFENNANFFAENWQKSQKIVIITLVFEKNANFFAENSQKSQKIVIITSTPGYGAAMKKTINNQKVVYFILFIFIFIYLFNFLKFYF